MSKLYYTAPYERTFTAEVVEVLEKEGNYHIVLDQTAFYPEGGGQPCDLGFIEDCPITYVYEKDAIIYHVSPKKPIKIHKIKASIDWLRRLDHMQQHLAQHLLSAYLLEQFNATTLSFHLGKDSCTLDLDKSLTKLDLQKIEQLCNEAITENIPVTVLYPTKQELKKLSLKKLPPKEAKDIRLVQIGDLDLSPCCGTHPQSTLELQLIKITKVEKHKTGIRFTFLAGHRATQFLLQNAEVAASHIDELTTSRNKLENEVRKLKSLITDYEVKEMISIAPVYDGLTVIKQQFENLTPKELQNLGTKLVQSPDVVALLGLKVENTSYLVFMCSSNLKQLSMNTLLQDSITLIDGRGGGTSFSAQGGGKSPSNLASALDYALMKLGQK